MAFKIRLSHVECDKCLQRGTDDNPVVYLKESTRDYSHIIFIHLYCFDSAVAKLQKKAAFTSPKLDEPSPLSDEAERNK